MSNQSSRLGQIRLWSWQFTFLAVLTGTHSAQATDEPPTIPANVQAEIRKRVDHRYSVAMIAGVFDTTGAAYFSYGTRTIEGGEPVDENTVFEIGSITKTFTTLLLADMVERGELALTNLVRDFVPEDIHVPQYGNRAITLTHLASHGSGLPRMPTNFTPADLTNPYADYGEQKLFEFLDSYELPRAPGSLYEYSNYGMGLLGYLLSRSKGLSYEELLQQRILDVLGLNDTSITLSESQRQRLAHGYSGVVSIPNWGFGALAGAGAIRSTAKDMLAYLATNLGLRDSPLYSAMTNSHKARITASPGLQVGLGWHILSRGGRQFVFHDGQTGGYSALIAFEQEAQRAVVVLASGWAVASDLGFYLLDSSLGPLTSYPVPPSVPVEVLRRYHGKVESAQGDSFLINLRQDHLIFTYSGDQGQSFTLYPSSTNRFQAPAVPGSAQATFLVNSLGEAAGMRWTQSGATTLYSRKRLPSNLDIRRNGPEVELTVIGETGVRYAVERSADLRSWTTISTNTIWDAAIKDSMDRQTAQFYRVRGP